MEAATADPPFAIAGEKGTWRLPFVLSKAVPAEVARVYANSRGWRLRSSSIAHPRSVFSRYSQYALSCPFAW